jgi:hypothetical protein
MPRIYVVLLMSGLAMGMSGQRVMADEVHAAPAKPTAPAADSGTAKATKPRKAKPHDGHDAHDASSPSAEATPATKPAKHKHASATPDGSAKPPANAPAKPGPAAAPVVAVTPVVNKAPAAAPGPAAPSKPQPPAAPTTSCSLEEREQPRGGRLDVVGTGFGQAPVVRIAQRPARMIERRSDRISVQVPADSDGGLVTLQTDKRTADCGTLVIIGKNR